jgi:aldose sugar dehydrogenase
MAERWVRFTNLPFLEQTRARVTKTLIDGICPHDTSVILRINPENASGNPFSNNDNNNNGSSSNKLSRYYAHGIRNSFGISFDPISENLWDTENGENTYDEINLVKPGFNSGWQQVMGPISRSNITEKDLVKFIIKVLFSSYIVTPRP